MGSVSILQNIKCTGSEEDIQKCTRPLRHFLIAYLSLETIQKGENPKVTVNPVVLMMSFNGCFY